jgi:hypothetical protein
MQALSFLVFRLLIFLSQGEILNLVRFWNHLWEMAETLSFDLTEKINRHEKNSLIREICRLLLGWVEGGY